MQNQKWISGLFVIVAGLFIFNLFLQTQVNSKLDSLSGKTVLVSSQTQTVSASAAQASAGPSADQVNSMVAKLIPKGVPEVYGAELGINFDNPVEGLDKLAKLDKDMGTMYDPMLKDGKITKTQYDQMTAPYKDGIAVASFDDAQKARFIKIGTMISCEYCCGSKAMVTKEGLPACGCAHSAAMRGLAKYLIKNHPELNDDQVLEFVKQVKALSFPKQTVEAALKAQGIGGTSAPANTGSTSGLPSQVGGC